MIPDIDTYAGIVSNTHDGFVETPERDARRGRSRAFKLGIDATIATPTGENRILVFAARSPRKFADSVVHDAGELVLLARGFLQIFCFMIVIFLAFNHMLLIWSNNPWSSSSLEQSHSLALAALSTLHDCSLPAFNSTSSGLIATIGTLHYFSGF